MSKNFKKIFLDTLFPQFCVNCDKEGKIICSDCLSLIEITDFTFCPFCAKPNRLFKKGVCPNHSSHHLDGLYFAVSYQQKLVKKMLAQFKYEPYLKTLAPTLAFLIITHFIKTKNTMVFKNGENPAILPIPLTENKKRKRGYNQAEALAEILAGYFHAPLLIDALVKIKKTPSQVGLSLQQRNENVRGAFTVKKSYAITDKKIFLVDDVFTTGSTMEEAAKALKIAGAKSVWGIAVAREPLNQ